MRGTTSTGAIACISMTSVEIPCQAPCGFQWIIIGYRDNGDPIYQLMPLVNSALQHMTEHLN